MLDARWRHALLLLLLTALALWPRWDRLQYVTFRGDQAWSINRALDFVLNGDVPLTGIRSSVGTAQGALEIWLLALPVTINPDPAFVTGFVGLLQVGAVLLTYLLGTRYFGAGVGALAAFSYAINPWAINYARRIWTQDMLPLFAALFILCLFLAAVERKRWAFPAACGLMAALFLLHPAAVIYAPLLLAVALLWGREWGWRSLLAGPLVGLLLMAPYLYADAQTGYSSLNTYLALASQGGPEATAPGLDLSFIDALPTLASGANFPMGQGDGFAGEWRLPDLRSQHALLTVLMYAGLFVCGWRAWRALRRDWLEREGRAYLLPLLWYVLPVLLSTRNSVGSANLSYFLIFYPLQFMLVALSLKELTMLLSRLAPGTGAKGPISERVGAKSISQDTWFIGLALAMAVWVLQPQLMLYQRYLDYVQHNGPRGDHGVPLLYQQSALQAAKRLAGAEQPLLLYYGSGSQGKALAYLARPELELRRIDANLGPVLPADLSEGSIVIVGPEDEAAFDLQPGGQTQRLLPALAALGYREELEAAVTGADGTAYFRLFRQAPAPADGLPAGFTAVPAGPSLPGGLRLIGYSLPAEARSGEPAPLALLWSVEGDLERYRDSGEVFLLYAHLVDELGAVVGNQESDPFVSDSWRKGDRLTTTGVLDSSVWEAPAVLWLEAGGFRRYGRETLPWRDASGSETPAARYGPMRLLEAAPATAQQPLALSFGGVLQLDGYSLAEPALPAGGDLEINLHWRALQAPARDYKVSVQILDADGRLRAQHDSLPAEGRYPTRYWRAGEQVSDLHRLALPAELMAGQYQLQVVVYGADNAARLPVDGGAATSAPLGTLRLVR